MTEIEVQKDVIEFINSNLKTLDESLSRVREQLRQERGRLAASEKEEVYYSDRIEAFQKLKWKLESANKFGEIVA